MFRSFPPAPAAYAIGAPNPNRPEWRAARERTAAESYGVAKATERREYAAALADYSRAKARLFALTYGAATGRLIVRHPNPGTLAAALAKALKQ